MIATAKNSKHTSRAVARKAAAALREGRSSARTKPVVVSGTSAILRAKKRESEILVNVDNMTFKKIMNDECAMQAIHNIEGFRALGADIFETVVDKSEAVSKTKKGKATHSPSRKRRSSPWKTSISW